MYVEPGGLMLACLILHTRLPAGARVPALGSRERRPHDQFQIVASQRQSSHFCTFAGVSQSKAKEWKTQGLKGVTSMI